MIKALIKKKEVSGSFNIAFSNVLISLFSFVLFYLVAKDYGAVELGVFGVFYSTLMMVTSFFDQGVSLTTVHFYNAYLDERDDILNKTFFSRLYSALLIAVPLYFVSDLIAVQIFGKFELGIAFKAAAIAIATGALPYFSLTVFRAKEMYAHFAMTRFWYIGLATILSSFLILVGVRRTDLLMYMYSLTACFAFVLSLRHVDWGFLKSDWMKGDLLNRMFHYGKWALLSILFYTASRYVLLFLIGVYSDLAELGKFSLASQITNGIGSILASVTIVLFSYSSKLKDEAKIREFLKTSVRLLVAISVFVLLALFFGLTLIIDWIFPDEYQGVALMTAILFVGHAMLLTSFPLKSIIVNYYKDTKGIFYLDLLLFFLIVLVCPFLLKEYSIEWGAVGYSASYFIAYWIGRGLRLKYLRRIK